MERGHGSYETGRSQYLTVMNYEFDSGAPDSRYCTMDSAETPCDYEQGLVAFIKRRDLHQNKIWFKPLGMFLTSAVVCLVLTIKIRPEIDAY